MTSRLTFRQLMGESAGEDRGSRQARGGESPKRREPLRRKPLRRKPQDREQDPGSSLGPPLLASKQEAASGSVAFAELMGDSEAGKQPASGGAGGKRAQASPDLATVELAGRIAAASRVLTGGAAPERETASMSALMAPQVKEAPALSRPIARLDPTPLSELLEAEASERHEAAPQPSEPGDGAGVLCRLEDGGVYARAADCPPWLLAALMRGACPPVVEVDLHGYPAAAVEGTLGDTLKRASERRGLCVRVVCGRGLHSGVAGAVLPEICAEYLMGRLQARQVLAFCTAPARFGGQGAFLVRLRLSD